MSSAAEKPHLANFPTELLSAIFNFVRFDNGPVELNGLRYSENLFKNTIEIRNLRLVCTRFAEVAAPLLLRVATCSILDPQSVDALEHISRHPVLSRSVKVLRVRLGFYDPAIAQSLARFANYLFLVWRLSSPKSQRLPHKDDESFSRLYSTLMDWRRVTEKTSNGDIEDPCFLENSRILHLLHQEYIWRYLAQLKWEQSGNALRRVAIAMARMTGATRLVLDDSQPSYLSVVPAMLATIGTGNVNDEELMRLVAPVSWEECWETKRMFWGASQSSWEQSMRGLDLCNPPMDLVINIPVAINRAGVRLTCLGIFNLQIPPVVPAWGMTGTKQPSTNSDLGTARLDLVTLAELCELKDACRSLLVLEIRLGSYESSGRYSGGTPRGPGVVQNEGWSFEAEREVRWTYWVGILRSILPENLKQLDLDADNCDYYVDSNIDRGWHNLGTSMFEDRPLPNLEVFHLSNASATEGAALARLVQNSSAIRELHLQDVGLDDFADYLNSPTDEGCAWLLEILREQTPRMRQNGLAQGLVHTPVRVRDPDWHDYGACPLELRNLARSYFNKGNDGSDFNAVENYIRGATDRNPLTEAMQ